MKMLLGTHEPSWLGRSPAPLFISLRRRTRFPRRPRPGRWALDSGGFTTITAEGGWTTTPTEHRDAVYDLADRHPGLEWAAPQDWMCEPDALTATGLTVAEHQHRTVDNYLALRDLDPRHLFIPVLQGFAPGEHEACAELYTAAGIDLTAEPLVGIGTICRRQGTPEIRNIIYPLAAAGYRLHGFGVKTRGLNLYADLLTSADSLAWSQRARSAALHGEGPLGDGCTHRSCSNCYRWAHQWHARILDDLETPPAAWQPAMF